MRQCSRQSERIGRTPRLSASLRPSAETFDPAERGSDLSLALRAQRISLRQQMTQHRVDVLERR